MGRRFFLSETLAALAILATASPSAAGELRGTIDGFTGLTATIAGQKYSGNRRQVYKSSATAQPLSKSVGADGGGLVLGAGYDFALGNSALIGLVTDLDLGRQSYDYRDSVSKASFQHESEMSFDAGVRLGFAPSPDQLLYITGGYSRARYSTKSQGIGGPAVVTTDTSSNGWFGGAGFDYRINDVLDLKTEYRARIIERGKNHVVGPRAWSYAPIDQEILVGLSIRPLRESVDGASFDAISYVDDGISVYGAVGGIAGAFNSYWQGYSGSNSEDRAGQMLGVRFSAGADMPFGNNWFGGAVIGYDMRDGDSKDQLAPPVSSHTIDIDDAISLGLRAGIRTDAGLLYLGGGYVRSSIDGQHLNSTVSEIKSSLDGYYLNFGTEIALHEHVGFQLEYRLEDYEKASKSKAVLDQQLDLEAQSITAGLVFRY